MSMSAADTEEPECARHVVWRWATGYPADCVEFCPLESLHHLLLCGTYKLLEDGCGADRSQEKIGTLCLLDVSRRFLLQRVETAAVLDVKWSPKRLLPGHVAAVAVAESSGSVSLYRLGEGSQDGLEDSDDDSHQRSSTSPSLRLQNTWRGSHALKDADAAGGGPSRMALALDWCRSDPAQLLVSDSAGFVWLLRVRPEDMTLETLWSTRCNDHEAWSCAFSFRSPHVVYTAGDDCTLRAFDTRCSVETTALYSPCTADTSAIFCRRPHDSGVTSLLVDQDRLHSGGYDGRLLTWDERSVRRPVCELAGLGGGLWRIKRLGRGRCAAESRLLIACMHGGASVVSEDGATVCGRFTTGHESMVYGADWCYGDVYLPDPSVMDPDPSVSDPIVIPSGSLAATCSFYDKRLCVWRVNF